MKVSDILNKIPLSRSEFYVAEGLDPGMFTNAYNILLVIFLGSILILKYTPSADMKKASIGII